MAISEDWQLELPARSLLIGNGTSYPLALGGLTGLFAPPSFRTANLPRQATGGDSIGRSRNSTRTVAFTVLVTGASARSTLDAVIEQWYPTAVGSELALDVRVPGLPETSVRLYGQPADVAEFQPEHAFFGKVGVDLVFEATDPLLYGAEVDDTGNTGTFSILTANLGHLNADTDRATITIEGNDGTPALVNTTHGGAIRWGQALATGATAVIDLHEMTVTRGGYNIDSHITSSSDWFRFLGGQDNSLTISGAASVDITYRPAYR